MGKLCPHAKLCPFFFLGYGLSVAPEAKIWLKKSINYPWGLTWFTNVLFNEELWLSRFWTLIIARNRPAAQTRAAGNEKSPRSGGWSHSTSPPVAPFWPWCFHGLREETSGQSKPSKEQSQAYSSLCTQQLPSYFAEGNVHDMLHCMLILFHVPG